jgi:hypothetical protein
MGTSKTVPTREGEHQIQKKAYNTSKKKDKVEGEEDKDGGNDD